LFLLYSCGGVGYANGVAKLPHSPVHQGLSSYYAATGGGSCAFDTSPHDLMVAAMNAQDYDNAALCGAYLHISGSKGDAIVRVVDLCRGCKPGGLDLSKEAFAKVADLQKGRDTVSWQVVAPALNTPLQYHFKEGSSAYWTGIQIRNHRTPIAKLEYLRADGSWGTIPRTSSNYFVQKTPGMGVGPYTLRVTDLFGNTIVDKNVPLQAGGLIASLAQFPGGATSHHPAPSRWASEDSPAVDVATVEHSAPSRWVAADSSRDADNANTNHPLTPSRWVAGTPQHVATTHAPINSRWVADASQKKEAGVNRQATGSRWVKEDAVAEEIDPNSPPSGSRWVASEAPPVDEANAENEEGSPRWVAVEPPTATVSSRRQVDDLNKVVSEAAQPPVTKLSKSNVSVPNDGALDDLVKEKTSH
jgi:expansin (peptidoglycan-binding protein)